MHYFTLALFFCTLLALVLILYLLSCIFFTSAIEEELQIEKMYAYECGYSSFSDARDAFDIKFYLVAVLFLIFDLEISFLMPLAVTAGALGLLDISACIFFLGLLTVGFIFEWKKGGLDW